MGLAYSYHPRMSILDLKMSELNNIIGVHFLSRITYMASVS